MALFGFDSSVVPEIDFCVKDASLIQSDVITKWEQIFYLVTQVNKTLGRADPVRLHLMTIIYQLVVQRSVVDSTGKLNLLKYSHGDYLDNIGARWGPTRGRRLGAQKARTTLRFSLRTTLATDVVVAYGMVAQTNEGIQFATTEECIIIAGSVSAEAPAEAVNAGAIANGFVAGQVIELVTWNQTFLVDVTNTTTTSGGSERENDERFRARIWMAPESFSVAGPYGAYEYWTASVNPDIESIEIFGDPAIAGEVWIYFLMLDGRSPTLAEKQQVLDLYHPPPDGKDNIRPLTDLVSTPDLDIIEFIVNAIYYIESEKAMFAEQIREGIEKAYQEYLQWQQGEINRDIVPNKMTQFIMNAGAKRLEYRWSNPNPPDVEPLHTGFTLVPSIGFLGCAVARLNPISPGLRYGGLEARIVPAPPVPAP